MASRISGIPYSFTAHAYDIYKKTYKRSVIGAKIRKAKFVVAVSEASKAYLQQIEEGSADKIKLIYNGINLDRFKPVRGTPPPPFTILAVARLIEKKGLPILVEACRHLRDSGFDFRCFIIGQGRQRPQLTKIIKAWELQDRVRLLGAMKQDEVLEWYHSAHLVVLPSVICNSGDREGLPVSIVEALACGLPVVSTPVGGIPEAVKDRYNGLLVASGDPMDLADALQAVIEGGELYSCLKANARISPS